MSSDEVAKPRTLLQLWLVFKLRLDSGSFLLLEISVTFPKRRNGFPEVKTSKVGLPLMNGTSTRDGGAQKTYAFVISKPETVEFQEA